MDVLKSLRKFNDIYVKTENYTTKQKGDLFELFTLYLFKHDPRLNHGLENIWLYADVPQKVLKYLKYPDNDKGVDLIAKISGKYYAIQSKFRQNPNKIIPWGKLSSFFGLSFGITNRISGGFFVTNTRNLCQEVINSDFVVPIYDDYYDEIPRNFFKCIENNKITYQEKYPLQYQSHCIIASFMHLCLDNNSRGYINMACGSGKTLTAYWINKHMCNKKTVIFVPSLYLLSQFYVDWVQQSYAENRDINYVLIGSDADVGGTDYVNNGLILSTDPIEIKKHIKSDAVVICTYQSSDKLAEACGKKIKFDLAIFDEAHKTVGQKNKQFSRMLTNKYMKIDKRLFMTATPKDYVGENDDITGMNDEEIYGECIYSYITGQAILDKRLTDYCVLSIDATNASIESAIKKNKLVKYKDEFDDQEANYLGTILIILKKFHDGTINHLITYHNAVSRAKKFAEFLEKINQLVYGTEILVNSIDGSDSMRARKNTIREFSEASRGIMCSARVLNEGVNIPVTDSVCFVDARESTIDLIQCIGRCLRLFPGKNMAYVIVPTFIENFDTDNFDKNVFGNVIRILKALKDTDERIVEYFQLKCTGKVAEARGDREKELVVREVFENVSGEIDLEKWQGCVDAKLWRVVDGWNCRYEEVKEWIEINGRMPSGWSDDIIEKMLGHWCAKQRVNKKKGKLIDNHINKLEIIKLWYWKQNLDEIWESIFHKLKEWIKVNNKLPLSESKNIEERSLGHWCVNQRRNKKENKLTEDRMNKLNTINLWYWELDELWKNKCIEVKKWMEINKRMPSEGSDDPIERSLKKWLNTQRLKGKNNKLSSYQIEQLNSIDGWYWIVKKIKTFDERCLEVNEWIKINGKMPVDHSKNPAEKSLSKWCGNQRQKKKNNTLSKNKIIKLNTIPHWFWSK